MSPYGDFVLKRFYSYNRPFKEVKGYSIDYDSDNNPIICMNALGIDPEDVKIEQEYEYPSGQVLTVSGVTEDKVLGEKFTVDYRFSISKNIKKIIKSHRSGLLTLKIIFDKPEKATFEIIDDEKLLLE